MNKGNAQQRLLEAAPHSSLTAGVPVVYDHFQPLQREGDDFLFSPASALRTLHRWWLVVLPVSCGLAIASCALVWYLFEPQYRAAAWIQIQDKNPYLVSPDHEPPEASERFVETQIELLSGDLVLEPVVAKPDIRALPDVQGVENPSDVLAEKIAVVQVGMSEMYQVSYTGPSADHAARIVNAVVDEYFQLRHTQQATRSDRMVELLEEEKQRRAVLVRDLRDRMRQLNQEVYGQPLFDPQSEDTTLGHPLQGLEERIASTEVDRRMLEIEAQALEESIKREEVTIPDYMVELAVDETTEIQDLRAVIAEKRAILQRTESVARLGRQDPAYQRLQQEIADHEATLEEALGRARPRVRHKLETMSALDRDRQLAELNSRADRHRSIEEMLRGRYQARMQEFGQVADSSLELEFLRAELAREEHIFELIGDRVTTLRTETRAPGRVIPVREARPPDDPVQRFPVRHLALALLLSLCLPWGGVFAWEYHARPISDAEQVQKQSSLAVLAEIARLPTQARVRRVTPRATGRGLGVYEESIDSLRTCLTLAEPSKEMTSFAIASAVSGEGKSSVAAQLAVSLARSSNARILLIDADLRSPDIHRLFRVPLSPGLAQVLDGACSVDEAVATDWSDHLHILPAGTLHKNPHKLVAGGAFHSLLEQLSAKYDCVIIDTAPVLAASESLVIAQQADGVVLCTMRDRSREDQVRRARTRLVASGAHLVGAVLNGIPTKRYARTYGSYPHVS